MTPTSFAVESSGMTHTFNTSEYFKRLGSDFDINLIKIPDLHVYDKRRERPKPTQRISRFGKQQFDWICQRSYTHNYGPSDYRQISTTDVATSVGVHPSTYILVRYIAIVCSVPARSFKNGVCCTKAIIDKPVGHMFYF